MNAPTIAPPSVLEACTIPQSIAGGGGILVHTPVVSVLSLVGQVLLNSTRLPSIAAEMLSDVRSQACSMSTSMPAVMLPLSLE